MPIEVSIPADSSRSGVRGPVAARSAVFASFLAASLATLLGPLRNLLPVSIAGAEHSYILLAPVMVLGLFYMERRNIFRDLKYSLCPGTLIILGGLSIAAAAVISAQLKADSRLSLE